MRCVSLVSVLASSSLLVAGVTMFFGAVKKVVDLWLVFNLLVEGLSRSSGHLNLPPILMVAMIIVGFGVTILALAGLIKVSQDYQVMVKSNMLAAVCILSLVAGHMVLMEYVSTETGLQSLQNSIKKYGEIGSVRKAWDDIQSKVKPPKSFNH